MHRGGFRVPVDNPLLGRRGDDAVYAWGLRNPWRFSFDRLTGNLVIADVGDNIHAREEIDYLSPDAAAGVNFGWPEYEGFSRDDPSRPGQGPLVMPISQYRHTQERCAITGGYVVRDPALPSLWGRYLYADFCGGRIRSLAPPELVDGLPAPVRVTDDRDEAVYHRYLSSFGEGLGGEIYVASLAGPVFRLVARGG
jgi:glucose/arabinose dehydrogenase